MPQYKYQGVDNTGNRVTGMVEVGNEGELRMNLRSRGIRPLKVSIVGGNEGVFGIGKKASLVSARTSVPIQVLIVFTRQLQLLISSGIPLVYALELLADQTNNPQMREVIRVLKDKVSGGMFLWESLSGFPRVFPKLYFSLVRAGESSGSMDQVLRRLSKYIEDEDRLKRMVKSAMMYPIIVLSIGAGVVALMLTFVIPKFEKMLKESGQELPDVTLFVITLSHFFANNFHYLIGGCVALGYAYKRFVETKEGRALKDRVVFRSPLFGIIAQKAGIARFARTLQTLLAAGVNLIDAIDICMAVSDNAVLEGAIGKIRGEIESGKNLGETMLKIPEFTKMSGQMVMVGESTGNLDKSLEKVADFYESEVEILVGGLTKLIEPIVLVILGGLVGGLMIAMYMPIFKMAGSVG
jgi:type IV pilus assembly protein PilC